jgi:hypothetical protein
VRGGQPSGGLTIERQDLGIGAANDQQRGRRHMLQGRAGQVGSAATRDHPAEPGGQPVDGTDQAPGK